MKGLSLSIGIDFDKSSEPERSQQVNISSEIVELSRQYPMFSEEEHRLKTDVRECDINSTALRSVPPHAIL